MANSKAAQSTGNLEIETKIIGINPAGVRKSLKACGAKYLKKVNYRIAIIRRSGANGRKMGLRLRTDGTTTTMTLKDWNPKMSNHPMEYETTVADFDTALEMLKLFIGEPELSEKTREIYRLGRAEIVIDKAVGVPYHMEIEAPSEKEVMVVYEMLGRPGTLFGNFPTETLYKHYGLKSAKKTYKRTYYTKKIKFPASTMGEKRMSRKKPHRIYP